MKPTIATILTLFFGFASVALGQPAATDAGELKRIDADPSKGFSHAYYLYIPKSLTAPAELAKVHSFIVIPNNTGKLNDDIAFHDNDVKRKMAQVGPVLNSSGFKLPVLMPVFPRPAAEHNIYTHSLDRDTFVTDKKQFSRLDLQLASMIKDARLRLTKVGVKTERRVLMQGYSASGMFVNRFVFLHPNLVKAAIVGAPGGWAIAPADVFNGKSLTFPVGTSDLKELSGKKFDLGTVRKVSLFMILGGADTNDAVPMGDAYDKRETDLVMDLFGKTPVERFPVSEKLYREAGLDAEFKLYPDTTHQMSKQMRDDQLAFLKKHAL